MKQITPPYEPNSRDIRLDVYRALMMIYVPCVIHVLYWIGKGGEIINSLLLFEMPVIFYISGATMYITGNKRKFVANVANRTKRLLLPYVFFILVCLAIVVFGLIVVPDRMGDKPVSFLRIITAQDCSLALPFMYHLWFIVPYLLVSCSFTIQRKWADSMNRWLYMGLLGLICLVVPMLTSVSPAKLNPVREAVFYNFFFMAGYLFYKRISFRELMGTTVVAGILVTGCLWYEFSQTGHLSMQAHKFPPDLIFLCFGIFSICLLAAIFGNFSIPQNRLLRRWNKYGYTIYLWQNFSFIIYLAIYKYLSLHFLSNYPVIDFLVASVGIFLLSTLTSLIIVPVEQKFIGLFVHKRNQKLMNIDKKV